MKAITAIGIAGAFAALLLAVMMEGGNPAGLLNIPAFVIVIVGTGAATVASTNVEQAKTIPKLYQRAFKGSTLAPNEAVAEMVRFAEKARREGLLAIEKDLDSVE